jgi:mRNA-degrading endonuclease toxin of MazEF toxin-antitoxin module
MADKIMAVSRTKLGRRLGAVSPADMARVQAALIIVLGFEGCVLGVIARGTVIPP